MQYIPSHEDTFQSSRATPPFQPAHRLALEDPQVGSVLDTDPGGYRLTGPLPPPTPTKSGHSPRGGGVTGRSASRFTSVTSRPHRMPDTAAHDFAPPPPPTIQQVSGPSLLSSSTSLFTPSLSSSASTAHSIGFTSRFARPHPTTTTAGSRYCQI